MLRFQFKHVKHVKHALGFDYQATSPNQPVFVIAIILQSCCQTSLSAYILHLYSQGCELPSEPVYLIPMSGLDYDYEK